MPRISGKEITERLWQDRGLRPRNLRSSGGLAPCPKLCKNSHEDTKPSFSVTDRGGKILVHCFSQCEQRDALDALIAHGLWTEQQPEDGNSDMQSSKRNVQYKKAATVEYRVPDEALDGKPDTSRQPDVEWCYRTGTGKSVAIHGRWNGKDGKEIRWRVPDGNYQTGLNGVRIEDMPLLNTDLVMRDTSEVVVFCEGEAAADALTEHGMLAVTNGGGAGQRSFGKSLEVLRDRNVVLFPDNDAPGRQLMMAVQKELKSIAKSVKILTVPNLPHKGDAVQYFEQGGTAENLLKPQVTAVEHLGYDRIRITIPLELSELPGQIVFLFEGIRSSRGRLEADVTVTPPVSPVFAENYSTKQRLNIKSSSSVTALRRLLESSYSDEIDWAKIVPRSMSMAAEAMTSSDSDSAIDLAKHRDRQPNKWLVQGLVPANANTMLYGHGSNLKTITVHSLMLSLASGLNWLGHKIDRPRNVLVLDYENFEDSWMDYQDRLIQGMPGADLIPEGKVFYLNANGIPLGDQVEKVIRQIQSSGIEVLIVDSAGLACGGDPTESDSALAYFRAIQRLNELGVTAITLAHVTKSARTKEGKKNSENDQPFGSIYWHNSARATYYVEAEAAKDRNDFYTVSVENKKMNIAARPEDWKLEILFKDPDGPIYVTKG